MIFVLHHQYPHHFVFDLFEVKANKIIKNSKTVFLWKLKLPCSDLPAWWL